MSTERQEETSGRRRMLASITAFAGVIVAKLTMAEKVEATATGTVSGASTDGYGILATPGAAAVTILPIIGTTQHGVIGSNSAVTVVSNGSGVLGVRNGAGLGGVVGVNGSSGYGVLGVSTAGVGVRGELPASSASNGIAVFGVNSSTYTGAGPGAGGFGAYGHSQNGHGLVGATGTAGGAAVVGATNGIAGAYAAAFYGPVIVGGDLIVSGAKSAAVPHEDGTHRLVYCVESPESWFEDFGMGELVDGRAKIAIEPGFAATADMSNYHVFLTGYDHEHLLHVSQRSDAGFTVRVNPALATLQGQCDLTGKFSWRVVAKRKDIAGPRLAKVTLPTEPVLPSVAPQKPTGGREA